MHPVLASEPCSNLIAKKEAIYLKKNRQGAVYKVRDKKKV